MRCPICGSESQLDQAHPEVILHRCWKCWHRFSQLKPDTTSEPYDADYYEKTHRNWFAHPDLNLFGQIARLIDREPEPRSLIDVGCGNGNFLQFLARRHPTMTLTGIDLSANQSTSNIEFVQGDVLSAELGRQFSVVVSLATIEHIADVRGFAGCLRRLVKPNGLVIVMTLSDESLLYRTARLLRRFGIGMVFDRLYSRHHLHHFSRQSLRTLLQGEGLEPEATILHNPPLASVDIPTSGQLTTTLMRIGVVSMNAIASVSRGAYLQTVISRARA